MDPPWLLPLLGLLDEPGLLIEPGLLVELGDDGEPLLEGEPLMRSESSWLWSSPVRSTFELSDVPEPLLDLSPNPPLPELEPFDP